MRKIILLNKDESVTMTKKLTSKLMEYCKYILIPIEEYDIGAFLMFKPNSYFSKFTHADVSFRSVIVKNEIASGDIVFVRDLDRTDKRVYSLTEFINYIHSLNKIEYINSLSVSSELGPMENSIWFSFFNIRVFNNKEIIYEIEISDRKHKYTDPKHILNKIEEIYNPILPLYDKNKEESDALIRIKNDKWKITSSIRNDCIFGIPLCYTKSIYFTTTKELQILKYCHSMWCGTFQYNSVDYVNYYPPEDVASSWREIYIDEELPDDYGFRTYDIWTESFNSIVEYVVYIRCIYVILTVMTEYQIFNELTNKISTYSVMDIEMYEDFVKGIRIQFNNDDLLTMDKFISEIYKNWVI